MPERYYHFKGKSEDIINSILSLLVGKEYYQEPSYYSNFLNNSQSARYSKKLKAILELMQKENFILIREDTDSFEPIPVVSSGNNSDKGNNIPSSHARVYLRQHGKQVLSEGGYKPAKYTKTDPDSQLGQIIPLGSNLAILVALLAGVLCII